MRTKQCPNSPCAKLCNEGIQSGKLQVGNSSGTGNEQIQQSPSDFHVKNTDCKRVGEGAEDRPRNNSLETVERKNDGGGASETIGNRDGDTLQRGDNVSGTSGEVERRELQAASKQVKERDGNRGFSGNTSRHADASFQIPNTQRRDASNAGVGKKDGVPTWNNSPSIEGWMDGARGSGNSLSKEQKISNSDYPDGRMIAGVADRIWTNISVFGIPHAPFDYNSGMDVRPVSRAECKALGVDLDDLSQLDHPLNFNLRFGYTGYSKELEQELLEALGAGYEVDGDAIVNRKSLERVLNAGTSDGAVKGWETRRVGNHEFSQSTVSKARGEVVVLADVDKMDSGWKKDGDFYVAPGKEDKRGARERMESFVATGQPIEVPEVFHKHDDQTAVGFINGRHRFSVLRDRGVNVIPVAVSKKQAADFKKQFGAAEAVENISNRDVGTYSKGCLMANLEPSMAEAVRRFASDHILEDNLAEFGMEDTPHVTVLYGFNPDVDAAAVLASYQGPSTVRFGKVGRFMNPSGEYDVLFISVESPELVAEHNRLCEQFKDVVAPSDYDAYKPHVTLAYVKPGTHMELDGRTVVPAHIVVGISELEYSRPDGVKEQKLLNREDDNPYGDTGCPACGEHAVGSCRCRGPHTMEDLQAGHGLKCKNGHHWSGDLVFKPNETVENSGGKPCGDGFIESGDTCHVGEGDPAAKSPRLRSDEVSALTAKLDNYVTEYTKEGKPKQADASKQASELLKKDDLDGALKSMRDGEIHYDIPQTYTALMDIRDEREVAEKFGADWGTKPGTYTAWRSGDLESPRGVFFSINESGAKAYEREGEKATKYSVEIKNPLVAKRFEDAYSMLSGKTPEQVRKEKDSKKVVNDWWQALDKKIMGLAKKKGYDSIVYTKPAPPAIRELVVFDKNAIKEDATHVANRAGVDSPPTEAQKAAGNYAKRKTSFQGLPVSIENEKGSERSGVGPDGTPWSVTMPCNYGYFLRSEGADGDHVDVYLGEHEDAPHVFVVNQIDPDGGEFDEHKVLALHRTKDEALATYHAGFSDGSGPSRMGGCITMSVDQFKDWLKNGDTTKPTEEPK